MIADDTGLSLGAVSLALRDHPSISPPTRARVQAAARRLGYHPDPKLATLMRHLRTSGGADYRETIAYLSFYGSHDEWRRFSQNDYYLGARDRAPGLGYQVELFHLGAPDMTAARMSRLLVARGIRGILLGPSPAPGARLALDWRRFATVTFGYSVAHPPLHRVTTDYYLGMRSALLHLEREGSRRIGLNVNARDDDKVLNLWRAAYALFQEKVPAASRVAINFTADGKGNLDEWLRHEKPDAIISAGCDFPRAYAELHGKSPPRGIRYVNLNLHHATAVSRGIDVDSYSVGRLACEHVIAMLQRNETGLPAQPNVLSFEGRWVTDHRAWLRSLRNRTPPEASS